MSQNLVVEAPELVPEVVADLANSPAKLDGPEPYPFDTRIFKINVNIAPDLPGGYMTKHVLRHPTFADEEAHEAMVPVRTSGHGKVEGGEAISVDWDSEEADARLYDKCVQSIGGFAPPGEDEPVDDFVPTPEILSGIMGTWKSWAVAGIYKSNWKVDEEGLGNLFRLGASRQWTITQTFDGGKNADGTKKPPRHVVKYYFREPTQAERRTYKREASASFVIQLNGGGTEERKTTNLYVVNEIFNSLIVRVTGGVVGNEPVDARNPMHLKEILGLFKKRALNQLFNALEGDLGNS